jgi:thioredoxin reductase (NADPH)
LRTFLTRNRVAFEWVDIDDDPLARFLLGAAAASDDEIEARLAGIKLPVLLLADGRRLEAPSRLEVARAVGLHTRPTQQEYDLAIVGAGPAGLTAAVYAASEGMRTVVLEREAPGGQAGASARIENYPGFPDGISGLELTQRTYEQARRFDAEFVLVNEVVGADPSGREPFRLELLDGSELRSRSVLLATGVEYRFLDVPGVAELTGRGICYGSAVSEAFLYRGSEVFVIGSGNSAAQAAVYFARHARQVTLLVRADSLDRSMSQYLIRQVEAVPNLAVRFHTELAAAEGTDRLQELVLRDRRTGTEERVAADGLAILIGQKPFTDWADGLLARDGQGFIVTGPDLPPTDRAPHGTYSGRDRPAAFRASGGGQWPLTRSPLLLETNVPGVFSAGDVRRGTPKRIASAVGDGALAVQLIHTYLDLHAAGDARAMNGAGVPREVAVRAGFLKQPA